MPGDVPNELVMARLSIQVAVVALESLFEKVSAHKRCWQLPRSRMPADA
jgi:hypothetical protein